MLEKLVEGVATSGPLVAFLLYMLLRAEGRAAKLEDERGALLERTLTTLNNVANLLDKWSNLLGGRKDA